MAAGERVIVHVDMDAFFAAIEQRDNPELRGKPVIVGADPKGGKGRGVAATCSYEARKFGVHSAMPISQAWRLCPQGCFVPPRMEAYEEASRRVLKLLEEFTPDIEQTGLDECFLDVTRSLHLFGSKRALAERIQQRITEETQLTASIGIAPNKMVAKIASDRKKPRGIVIVEPGQAESFLRPLPMGRLWGVGEKTKEILARKGFATVGDIAECDPAELTREFGKMGQELWEHAHGMDDRPVDATEDVKSIGNECTFEEDTGDEKLLMSTLMQLCESVAARLRGAETAARRKGARPRQGRTITTKIRLEGFLTYTRAKTVEEPVDFAPAIYAVAWANFERIARQGKKVRLIGVSVSGFEPPGPKQRTLFDKPRENPRSEKQKRLSQAIDRARGRFGDEALRQARSLPPNADRAEDSDGHRRAP
ncbi:MAG: DNA polymerase IV [Candidatus Brocadiia bacterium]|jgi:nucleotidyltransferase/DNA polymerase involved in DNA repair